MESSNSIILKYLVLTSTMWVCSLIYKRFRISSFSNNFHTLAIPSKQTIDLNFIISKKIYSLIYHHSMTLNCYIYQSNRNEPTRKNQYHQKSNQLKDIDPSKWKNCQKEPKEIIIVQLGNYNNHLLVCSDY